MPLQSKYKPDPSNVQSGYYNDRMGTLDMSQGRVTGDAVGAATVETAHNVMQISKALQKNGVVGAGMVAGGGGVPNPQVLLAALGNGGIPTGNRSSDDDRFKLAAAGGGWFVKPDDPRAAMGVFNDQARTFVDPKTGALIKAAPASQTMGLPIIADHADAGLVTFGIDNTLTKAEEDDDDDEGDLTEAPKEDKPASGEASSMALSKKKKGNLQKGMYGEGPWWEDYMGTPLYSAALKCELDYKKKLNELLDTPYKKSDEEKFYQAKRNLRDKYDRKRSELHIEMLELRHEQAKEMEKEAKRYSKSSAKYPVPENFDELLEITGAQVLALGYIGVPIEGVNLTDLQKGAGQKYIKRVPKPGGGYKYYYSGTRGSGSNEHLIEGSSHRIEHDGKSGHFHIQKADGDNLTLRHDESGKTVQMSKSEFVALQSKQNKAKKMPLKVDSNKAMKKGYDMTDLNNLKEWIAKSEQPADTQTSPATAEEILENHLQKAIGKASGMSGGMPTSDPPSRMPDKGPPNPFDGGKVEAAGKGTGPADTGMETAESTAKKKKQKGKNYQGTGMTSHECGNENLEHKTPGYMSKALEGNFINWSEAQERARDLRSMMSAQIMNTDVDQIFGLGNKPLQKAQAPEQGSKVTMLHKSTESGLEVYEADKEDQRIEKAFEQYAPGGGTVFNQTQAVNMNGQLHQMRKCNTCGTMTKSMYASCQACGTPKEQAVVRQGVSFDAGLQKALLPFQMDDETFGVR